MTDEEGPTPVDRDAHVLAQRWHDETHGSLSSCWCCCELCDPQENPGRSNPHWLDQV